MKKTTIGGQALIEGLLMIGPENAAVAVRKPDGEIVVDKRPLPVKSKLSKVPIIRGVINLVRQMVLGMKALMYSAEFVELEEEEKKDSNDISKQDNKEEDKKKAGLGAFIERILGEKFNDILIYFSVIVSLALSIGLFILLPNLLASLLKLNRETRGGVILLNVIEGLIRVTLFFSYIVLASLMKDVKRVWQYHGAEHKTIHCYEHEEELTVENIKKYSTKHPRCGTSFMFLVMIISILIFSLVQWHDKLIVNMLYRILLIPLVAGISYEVLKLAGRFNNRVMSIINAPGMFFQIFTTKEPDDDMIEVAIAAFNEVRVDKEDADNTCGGC
ncbi:MAG TPA: DUF1385 domain-containing protein [Clostridiaceae bacterium]|nr:DUF1385 domain-containing protein [Clostridiaceae bacterium]